MTIERDPEINIAPTETLAHQRDQILEEQLPLYRQAYSDRIAWLMACLSELAYIKFNPFCRMIRRKKD
ncbi:hypothetical protein P4S72_06175 [Vibrio sp. PP-XX7]